MDNERTERDTGERDERPVQCAAFGCPLPGTGKRGDDWLCYCHVEANPGTADLVTRAIRRHRAVYTATLDVRASACTDEWLRVYRQVQQRLLDDGYDDLLPDRRDFSPYRPGRPIAQLWLARLERFLADAVRDEVRFVIAQTKPVPAAKRAPSSRECVERMRDQLAVRAGRPPSPQWAFDLLDGIAANPTYAPPAAAVCTALDAIRSAAGRARIATATDDERRRWRVALEALGGEMAAFMPSREPGEDDEPVDCEAENDRV